MALAEGFGADMASYAASGVNDQNLAHRDFYLHVRRLFGCGKSVRTLAYSSNFLELNCDLLSDDLDRIAAEYGYAGNAQNRVPHLG